MALLLFVGIGTLLWLGIFVVAWVRRASRGTTAFRTDLACDDYDFKDDAYSVRGGVWFGWVTATYPMARLTADSRRLAIRISAPAGPRLACVERSDLQGVRFKRGLLGVGIHFVSSGHRSDGVTYWCFTAEPTRAALTRLGWLVPEEV